MEDLKKMKLTPKQLSQQLKNLLNKPETAPKKLSLWIQLGLKMIKPDKLKLAVEGKIDDAAWITNHLHFSNPLVAPLWRLGLKCFWNELESSLTSPSGIYRIVASNPVNAAILSTPQGIKWINKICQEFYYFLRLYTYGGSCILCGKNINAIHDSWNKLEKMEDGYTHSECWEKQVKQKQ